MCAESARRNPPEILARSQAWDTTRSGTAGQGTPGPGSPVATTRNADAVNEHGLSVANLGTRGGRPHAFATNTLLGPEPGRQPLSAARIASTTAL